MPSVQTIIDALSTPPLAALQQVLDTRGPFGPGDHTFTDFHTDGAFLLPAGTYGVGGTYGVMVVVNGVIPVQAGFTDGWVSPDGNYDESNYHQRIAQIVIQHQLPITGAFVTIQKDDMVTIRHMVYWTLSIGTAARVGLHVTPNWHVDMYYLCVL